VSPLSPEDRNRSSFQNVVFSSFLEYWMMDKVEKFRNSECYAPLTETFRTYLFKVIYVIYQFQEYSQSGE
jgi:hypothetical protein